MNIHLVEMHLVLYIGVVAEMQPVPKGLKPYKNI